VKIWNAPSQTTKHKNLKNSITSQYKTLLMTTDALDKKENQDIINIEQYNKDIDEAMARIDKGEFTTHEDLLKEMETW